MFWMGLLRREALELGRGQARATSRCASQRWPPRATQVANCFHNQLELPMLFYVLVAFILITSTNSLDLRDPRLGLRAVTRWCTPTSTPAATT